MKILRHAILALLALMALTLASVTSMAQPTNIFISPQGDETGDPQICGGQVSINMGPHYWQEWYNSVANSGTVNYCVSFDTNNPPPLGDTNGSVNQQVTFDGANYAKSVTYAVTDHDMWGAGSEIDLSQYASIQLDFKYDTNSTVTQTNNAQVEVNVYNNNDGGNSDGAAVTNFQDNAQNAFLFDGNWHHLSLPLDPSVFGNITHSKGVGFVTQSSGYPLSNLGGTFSYFVANIELIAQHVTIPPPKVGFDATVPGLNLYNDKAPNYTRHQVRTDNNNSDFNVDWVGQPKPVTYAWSIAHFPTNSGAAANFAITPDPAAGATYADPDWSSTNCFYIAIGSAGGSQVVANVTCKTNQAIQNSTAVSIAMLTNNTGVGKWALTFTSDTAFTLTAPGGNSVSATIPANFLTTPYTNVSIFLSATPGNDNNYGSYVDYTSFDVTGVGTPIHEDFTQGHLNASFLELQDQTYGLTNQPNIIFVTTNDFAWMTWTLPDGGYAPVSRTSLTSGGWTNNPGLTNIFQNGTQRRVKISKSSLPGAQQGYFGLVKRTFSQILVLLDGETNAPGTSTGKTGSPTVLSGGNTTTTFTVLAVDNQFNPIPGISDTMTFTSTDGGALLPNSAPLVNGTYSSTVIFSSPGSFTITATDTTSTNVPPPTSTSSTQVINP